MKEEAKKALKKANADAKTAVNKAKADAKTAVKKAKADAKTKADKAKKKFAKVWGKHAKHLPPGEEVGLVEGWESQSSDSDMPAPCPLCQTYHSD
jgi:hypothetical protein